VVTETGPILQQICNRSSCWRSYQPRPCKRGCAFLQVRKVAEADGNRTRQRPFRPLTGFEDRGTHQASGRLHVGNDESRAHPV
jgi:hypothetical protein